MEVKKEQPSTEKKPQEKTKATKPDQSTNELEEIKRRLALSEEKNQ